MRSLKRTVISGGAWDRPALGAGMLETGTAWAKTRGGVTLASHREEPRIMRIRSCLYIGVRTQSVMPRSTPQSRPVLTSAAKYTTIGNRVSSSPPPIDSTVKGATIPLQEVVAVGVVHRDGGDIRLIG